MSNSYRVLFPVVSCVSLFSQGASAFPRFLKQFSDHYTSNQIDTRVLVSEQSCGLCHVRSAGGGRRNPFGEDFENVALRNGGGFPSIEFLDSDKDGFINLEEIFLQTAPAKPDSAPAGRIALELKEETTLSVTPASPCAVIRFKSFGFTFQNGNSEFEMTNVSAATTIKVSGRGAIIARCDSEKLVGSLLKP